MDVLVDQVRSDGTAIARSYADAPEIDGQVQVKGGRGLKPGDLVKVRIERADAFDLIARLADAPGGGHRLNQVPVAPRRLHRVISRA
jgi:ribosomal protein S12 methylthiotransferase